MSLGNIVDYDDLVAGRFYGFTTRTLGVYVVDKEGKRISGPHESIEFFLISPELTIELNGSGMGYAIKVLVGEEIRFLGFDTSYKPSTGELVINGTFWEVEDEK